MPYLDFALSKPVSREKTEWIKAEAAKIMQRHAGKGEAWLYLRISGEQTLFFKGFPVDNGGVVEVKLVGSLSGAQKKEITSEICQLLQNELKMAPDQIYIIFTEVKGENWGWNGQTFG